MSQDPIDPAELERRLGLVQYQPRLSYYEGLEVFRLWLREGRPEVLAFLQGAWEGLADAQRPAIAFALAEYYRQAGDVSALRALYAPEHPRTRRYVLNALWGAPGEHHEMGPCIVELALRGAGDADPEVRAEACAVFQNQAGWGVDVTAALEPLHQLLQDPAAGVRRQAACAIGNLAKKRYAVATALPLLTANLEHPEGQVRDYAGWALWQLSRWKHDLGPAVPALVRRLARNDDYGDVQKHASGALTHHAKKSAEHAAQVRFAIREAAFMPQSKPAQRLFEALDLTGSGTADRV